MRHSLPRAPQFYVTAPQECPYLSDRMERKLFTSLAGTDSQILNNALSHQGFRRSQNVLYRPSCNDCSSCLSARVPVASFKPSKSQKRVLKKNNSVTRRKSAPIATENQFHLFQNYVKYRHSEGGMAGMDEIEFSSMIEETSVETILCEYYSSNYQEKDRLIAVSLTDVLSDGLSMVYSFYDTSLPNLSLGKYMILDHINLASQMFLNYLYLGYWVSGSNKMNYKVEYQPLEVFRDGSWSLLGDCKSPIRTRNRLINDITDKQDTIYLPDSQS